MFHPLAPDLSKLSSDELYKNYSDLQKRFNQAYRFGPVSVMPQLQMLMEQYQFEIGERNRKQMEEMAERTSKNSKGGYKGIIDIS